MATELRRDVIAAAALIAAVLVGASAWELLMR